MKNIEKISISLVFVATLSMVFIVPENPAFHLDDPNYWGVIGYCAVFLVVLFMRILGNQTIKQEKILLTIFLAAMPLIYIADWLRFDRKSFWIWIEIVGLFIYVLMAILSTRRRIILLGIGIAAHGLWDLFHFNQQLYVPNWYVIACAVVDCAAGFYVVIRFKTYQLEVNPL